MSWSVSAVSGRLRPTVKRIRSIFCVLHFSELVRLHWDGLVHHTSIMDYETLKLKLAARRGKWSELSAQSGVDRRTIYRVIHEPGYNPTYQTLRKLTLALRAVRAPRSEPA